MAASGTRGASVAKAKAPDIQDLQGGSICITSNQVIKDWPEVLADDDVIATAILDRLLHNCNVLKISGRSYRRSYRLRDLEAGLFKGA